MGGHWKLGPVLAHLNPAGQRWTSIGGQDSHCPAIGPTGVDWLGLGRTTEEGG